jgi:NodT family efflux transporter outer membrane factor (OMF) lipoprotein
MPPLVFPNLLPPPDRQPLRRRTDPHTGVVALAAIAAAVVLVLTGCATQEARPAVEVSKAFAADAGEASQPEVAWWESFHDPVLGELVRRAANENRDVKIAAERLRAARAGQTVSRSFLWPSLSAVGTAADKSSGYSDAVKQGMPDTKSGSAGLDVAWEIDLSGRLRAGADAATADALTAAHGVRGVRLLVMSEVATQYFTLTGAQRQLETLRQIVAAHDETLRLVTARQRAGLATAFDVERARTDAEAARAQIPPLETIEAVSRHRIAVLVGAQAADAARIEPWHGEVVVPPARPGQPAELLQRRPDVLALMAQVDAANARRRQAAAEWFPRLFLDASFGRQNVEVNGVGLGSARFTNAAALLAMPIFNAGRTSALNEAAESGQREAVLRAEDGIVKALEDVENSLVALSAERRRAQSLQAAASSAEAAHGRAQSLYDRGQIDLLPLLDAQRARLAVRMAANDSQTRLLLDSVQLYKALGGGWQAFEPAAQAATPSTSAGATRAPQS